MNCKKIANKVNEIIERHPFAFFSLLMCFIAVFAYRQYLFGNKIFVFSTLEDSIGQTYPYHLYYARRIENGEVGSFFNFMEGLGKYNSGIIFSLQNWFCFFGEKNVDFLLGVNQALKVFLAGEMAFLFAKLKKGNTITCMIIGIGYSFCTNLIIRQEFFSYGIEAVVIIAWLLIFEYSYIKDRVIFIPLITWVTFYYLGTLDSILWACTFVAYIVFSGIISDEKIIKWKKMAYYEFVFLSSFVLLFGKSIYFFVISAFGSTRFSSTIANTANKVVENTNAVESTSFFSLVDNIKNNIVQNIEKPYGLLAYFMRTIGMSIYGSAENYSGGIGSFLVDGGFYCGIIAILIIPFALYRMNRRKKILYGLAYLATAIYIIVPPFRYFANGYGCPGFRFSALRITLLLIITAIEGFNLFFDAEVESNRNCIVLGVTAIMILTVMMYAKITGKVQIVEYWVISALFVVLYTVVLMLYLKNSISKKMISNVLMVMISVEVIAVSWDYINNRHTLVKDGNPDKIVQCASKSGYNDGTREALDYIKKIDNGWYRIDKDYNSVFLGDPLAQDYYSTTVYIGGLGIGEDFFDVCNTLGLNLRGTDLFYGPMGNVYTQALWNVKYVLSKNHCLNTYGMSYVGTVGDISVYRNELALPVAYVSETGIKRDDLLELDDLDRQRMLLKACVVDESSNAFGPPIEYGIKALDVTSEIQGYGIDEVSNSEVLLVGVNPLGTDAVISYSKNKYGDIVRKGARARNDKYVYIENLGSTTFDSLYMAWPYYEMDYDGLEYTYRKADAREYYEDIENSIIKSQNRGLNILEHDDYHIKGAINTDVDGMLVTSIPYKGPWKIKIDGEDCETEKVNMYFLGTKINKGTHEVEIYYIPDNNFINVYSGIIITLLKVVCLGLILEFINQLYRKRLKKVNVNN